MLLLQAGEVEHGAYIEVEQQLKSGPTNVLGLCLCATECLGLTTLASHAELITDGQFSFHGSQEQLGASQV